MASPGRLMKYNRRSPKLTMISPDRNCGLKRTSSRPLASRWSPPPQSQNTWAVAGKVNAAMSIRLRMPLMIAPFSYTQTPFAAAPLSYC